MLVGRTRSVRGRVAYILAATVAVTVVGVALAALGAAAGLWVWPPEPSSPLGVTLGFVAGAIVFFELALLGRKRLRGYRLGFTRVWMWLHIWLGLVCLPVVLVHAGFGLGGPLSAATLVLFLLVTASGIWGLILQQWLPQRILAQVPHETIASQIDFVGEYHAQEAARLVHSLVTVPPEAETAEPSVIGPQAAELLAFLDQLLLPYLHVGKRSGSPLASLTEGEYRFTRLRAAVPEVAVPAVERLHELAGLRRQWDAQARMHFWLHNWLAVHLPLSAAMATLMVLHAVKALKYW
ncbi:Putative membrane protein OS=Rhodopirellula maiorica SM1 GN=RMSM_06455 PE=4 SV=1 [Gemmataceae bacterium]|nr:Putative membrane protein OS=Rhodopirellula maiorica SM1 GN=RMSM_06455 PE=4 SV=1 [Gemmataceae bacterium]VTT96708.1 Putative membrane protein OS=Rhodopirellula maiorica SM1 GN=RMSM_06455 PE=4 SV=1 [Gemmataceae bacterium]